MNRPNSIYYFDENDEWYNYYIKDSKLELYLKNLEFYCDELESKMTVVENSNGLTKKEQELTDRAKELTRALTEACYELHYYQDKLFTVEKVVTRLGSNYHCEDGIQAKPWQEWYQHLIDVANTCCDDKEGKR